MKKVLLSLSLLLTTTVCFVQSQYISFENQNETLKMFCRYVKNIDFNKQSFVNNPAGAIIYLDFDPNRINFAASNFTFSSLFPAGGIAPSLVNGIYGANSRLAAQRGGNSNALPGNGSIGTVTFNSKRALTGSFRFWTDGWGVNDNISDTDLYYSNGEDMLVFTSGANYNFITGLCNDDITGPAIGSFNPDITAHPRRVGYGASTLGPDRYVTAKISSLAGMSFILRDGDSYTKDQPGYVNGTYPNLNTNDYRANTAGANIFWPLNIADRASGIDPSTISTRISRTATVFDSSNSYLSGMGWTWDRRKRDYFVRINGNQISDYGIEGNIVLTASVAEFSLKSNTFRYLFNPSVAPWITNLNPYSMETQVLPFRDYALRIRDDRAGVEQSSIIVTFMLGSQVIGIFSGSNLNIVNTGGDALTPDVMITIKKGTMRNGKVFQLPIPTALNTGNTIRVIVNTRDNVGNQTQNPYDRYEFVTRFSCKSYPGCIDALTIYMPENGIYMPYYYGNPTLYVTGHLGTRTYPKLDTGSKILDCGTGVVPIFTGTFVSGSGYTTPGRYTGSRLYFQGGTASISGNIVTIRP